MKVIYFGTKGRAGHYAVPIKGSFSDAEIKEVESIDSDNFYSVFKKYEFKIAKFNNYTVLGFPASPDNSRGGSKTVVMIDGEASLGDFVKVIDDDHFLKSQFERLSNMYKTRWSI